MTQPVSVRLPAAEVAAVRRAADAKGISVSEYLRSGALGSLIPQGIDLQVDTPYLFDRRGNLRPGPDGHTLWGDLVKALRGDQDAHRRAESWIAAQFDVVTGNVAGVNPNIYRADSWAPQRDFEYPFWSALDRGTVDAATPLMIPQFTSASGMAAAHTQGVEPTSGTFVVTGQVVNPAPLSAKITMSREVFDQGSRPQSSTIIWDQIVRSWFEALEAASVVFLDSLAPTVITVTTAAVDAALVDSLVSQLTPLNFTRGGLRMRDLVLQVDLYGRLVGAKTTAGDRILRTLTDPPGAVEVGGRIGMPGWALAATGIVSANSYLFDRAAVHGWASVPNRLTFDTAQVANVIIGLLGYRVFAATDLGGIRRIAYDPV